MGTLMDSVGRVQNVSKVLPDGEIDDGGGMFVDAMRRSCLRGRLRR